MTRILKAIALAMVVVFALLIGASCTPQKKPLPPNQVMPRNTGETRNVAPKTPLRRQVTPNTTSSKAADDIRSKVDKIPGVNKTHVVITGSTALIGLDLKSNVVGKTTDSIKKEAARIAKAQKGINSASVTSEPDLVTRIKGISDKTKKGQPLSGFTTEIKDIMNRIKVKS